MGKMSYGRIENEEITLKFDKLSRDEHLEYIVNALYDYPDGDVEHSITMYELKYDASFEIDSKRYMYRYLKCMNMVQVLNLYDSLKEDEREAVITAIRIDHPHLQQMVVIHEEIILIESDVYTCIIQ